MKKVSLSSLDQLFSAIAATNSLYIPANDGKGQAQFTRWTEGLVLSQKLNTVRGAKDLFFPQVENLVNFKLSGKKIEVIENRDPAEPFVVFGVRACDCRSFDILDSVFLADPVDSFYAARREHGILVAMACHAPETSCFCNVFGIDCAAPEGDVVTWLAGEELYWKAQTEKGEKLTELVRDLLTEAKILIVPGSGFDWPDPDHFRIVMLPEAGELRAAMERMGNFLDGYKQK